MAITLKNIKVKYAEIDGEYYEWFKGDGLTKEEGLNDDELLLVMEWFKTYPDMFSSITSYSIDESKFILTPNITIPRNVISSIDIRNGKIKGLKYDLDFDIIGYDITNEISD